jgi:hypothetical protein
MENQRRGLQKALNLARKALTEDGKVAEEMKIYLQAIIEAVDDSETKEEARDFLTNLPSIDRIFHLKFNFGKLSRGNHQTVRRRSYKS